MKKIHKLMIVILSVLILFSVSCTVAYAEDSKETSETITQSSNELKTFDECLEEVEYATRFLIFEVLAMPTAVSVMSFATPLLVFLPISLPVSVVAGAGASLIGIINVLFIPLEALIMYMVQ